MSKVWFVTGCSRGLGRELAQAVQAAGHHLVATSAFGCLDVVVNNAGYIKTNSIEDLPEDEFRRQLEINFFGVYNVTRAALPAMHAQRDGHIIQISSIGGAAHHARPRGLPGRQVRRRRFQRGAGARGRAARHPRHLRRARRHAHRHVRLVDARECRACGVSRCSAMKHAAAGGERS